MVRYYNKLRYEKEAKRQIFILFFLLSLHIVLVNLSRRGSSFYWISSIVWLTYIGYYIVCVPLIHPRSSVQKNENIQLEAILIGILFVCVQLVVGLVIDNVGKSPYDRSFFGISINFFQFLPLIIGREMLRAYLLQVYERKYKWKAFIVITLAVIIFDFNDLSMFRQFRSLEAAGKYIARELAPLICKHIFLSYFAIYGGFKPAAWYAFLPFVFEKLFPILPVLEWLSIGAIGIMLPLYGIIYLTNKYEPKPRRRYSKKQENVVVDTIATVVGVIFLWFVVGVFELYPSVVATGSMEPMIMPGDVVIIKRLESKERIRQLKEGDVIQFKRDDITITHRVIEVVVDGDDVWFRTQGDNNSAIDSRLVRVDEVYGILKKVVPKIGYPTLWIKKDRNMDTSDVEF